MWGRLIGAFFYIPAGVMWARGMFSPALKKRVVGMGCLLAFQVIVFFLPSVPCLWPMDPDPAPDPAIFVLDLQDPNKKLLFQIFSAYSFWRYIYGTSFS